MTVRDAADRAGASEGEGDQAIGMGGALDVRIRYSPTLPLVRLAGDLDVGTVHTLRDALDAVATPDCPAAMVLLDVRGVTFCDIAGLQALEDASARLAELGKELVLYATPPRITGLIEMTGVAQRLVQRGPSD